ncbi:MAG TPA: cardiolipin synthase [Tenuifilaceae bacterium]|nr:cardiolipin synthase [Tenuifilaceae bacterium]HPE18293.1 cardiolipin synthase [Tenuifilaceae bacterium]HPJ46869.1 cardiolipin synthase [Tenuifilaceae bacterium]HPQ34616.1 cardiolipin synthase [Tenuifilaceae bacterium]HRX68948.1 cardiolipin synthase [Tenuifilaceae bacterium]
MSIGTFWNNIIVANISIILVAIYSITVLSTAIMVVREKRDPHKTSTWVLILILLPIVGLIFYIYFGQTFRKQKIFSRKGIRDLQQIETISKTQLLSIKKERYIQNPSIAKNINIITLLLNNSKALLTEYNKIDLFQTGATSFSAIIEAIENAKSSVHLQFYIISDDEIGNRIKDLLIKKANEGVEVRLIYDDVGSWSLPRKFFRQLHDAGVEFFPFMEVKFPLLTSKVNFRNHRKIIVIDGIIAFMGGINIADRYLVGDKKLGPWYDTMLRIEGEAVNMLQVVFMVDWFFVSKKVLADREKYFPDHKVESQHFLQITSSGPDSDWASIMQAFFTAITKATKHIYISSPYFIPNESILTALKTASLSGVDVRIMLPGKSDSTVVYWSSMSYVAELLEAGIKVYLFNRGFIHSKITMIDSDFSSVGSANMDIRSFEDNFEVLAMIYDVEFTKKLESQFLKDMKRCKTITSKDWSKRSVKQNMKESLARLFSPLF